MSISLRAPTVVVVPPQSPYKTLKDLIDAAKAQPGKLNHGGGSAGYQLMNEALNERAGIDIRNVPFKGASEALTAVASGTVDMAFADITASTELIKSGKLRPLAVTSAVRSSSLPDVPTVAELGYPGFDVSTWYGIFMPARTPAAVVDVVNRKVNELLATPDMKAAIQGQGAEALPMTSAQFSKVVADDVRKWKGIVEASGATIE